MKKIMVGLILGLFVSLPTKAKADDWGSYAAIAYSFSTGAMGQAYAPTLYRAQELALYYCNVADCQSMVWVRNGCASMAVGNTGWGTGIATFLVDAQNLAWQNCASNSYGCVNNAGVCSQ